MGGKKILGWVLAAGFLASNGCCAMCDRWCDRRQPVCCQPAACACAAPAPAPAPACGCAPAPTCQAYSPAPAAVPVPNAPPASTTWQQR